MNKFTTRKLNYLRIAAALLLSLFTIHYSFFTIEAHTFHTSLTRMDYNAENKTVEVSIQLFTHDLTKTLEKQTGKRIDLQETKDVDKLITAYLKEHFILRNSKDEIAEINWIGKEFASDTIWVYLEIPFNESPEGKSLQNSIFFESFSEQTNLVICKFDNKKADLLYKVGEKIKEIRTGGSQAN
jgi:hypothetical protein